MYTLLCAKHTSVWGTCTTIWLIRGNYEKVVLTSSVHPHNKWDVAHKWFKDKKLRQGDHIFKKLNSLSFPWVFQDILNFFPKQLKRKKFDECIFVGNHVTYFPFSLSFPWDFDNFSNSQNFPGFPCFTGLWPPCQGWKIVQTGSQCFCVFWQWQPWKMPDYQIFLLPESAMQFVFFSSVFMGEYAGL